MENIKNIILDLGGVLINLDYNKISDNLSLLGLSGTFSKTKQIELFNKLEEGKVSEKDFLIEFNRLAKANHNHLDIIKAWNSILLDFPLERIELLALLKEKYRLFLFSNTNTLHIKEVYNILNNTHGIKNLNHFFENIYLSNELGIRKPKVEGFNYIIKTNGLNPNETLFIDDSPQHVEAAKKAGINAQWLDLEKENITTLINRLLLI